MEIILILILVAFVCYQNRKETIFLLLSGVPMLGLLIWVATLFVPWDTTGINWDFIPALISFVILSAGIIGAGVCAFLGRLSLKKGWRYLPQIFTTGKWLVLISAELLILWLLTQWF